MDWKSRLRLLRPTTPAGRAAWPGALSLLAIVGIAVLAFAWPSSHPSEAASVTERNSPSIAQAAPQVRLPTPTPTRTPTVAPSPRPTATVTAAVASPDEARAEGTDADAQEEAGTPAEREAGAALAAVPSPPRGIGPRVNPRLVLLPPTVTQPPTLPAAPTPTPTLSLMAALQQPVTAGPPGIGARLATPVPTTGAPDVPPAPTGVADQPAVVAPPPTATPSLAPTPTGDVRIARVPILMYHYLSVPPPNADIYRLDLSVTPQLFAEHLDAMLQAGYTTISLYQWLAHLTQGAPLPEKPVVLTFDDGYRDNYTNAFPLLRERGMVATFFIVTDFIDEQRPEYLTWDMVREMYAAGMSIESHGRNHVSLAGKNRDYLVWQALGSLETIEYELGVRPRFISYPAGEYDQLTIEIFRSANYWAGFTTRQGATHRSDELFQARRVRVRGTTSAAELLRLLALDW